MKVLMLNGSARPTGNTYIALTVGQPTDYLPFTFINTCLLGSKTIVTGLQKAPVTIVN